MSNKPECPICFGEDWITRTKCNHVICILCLIKLTKDECPYCRREIFQTLPPEIKGIVKMNVNTTKSLNIFSHDQFPTLS